MQEVIKIAAFDHRGRLVLQPGEYTSTKEAKEAIESLPAGTYQVVKVLVKA
jgi:hypothetical protein